MELVHKLFSCMLLDPYIHNAIKDCVRDERLKAIRVNMKAE